MQYYEVITEPGSRSVMSAESDEEALSALKNHHERAMKGEAGRGKSTPRSDLGDNAPQVMDYPAERITRVLVYDRHPADYNEDMTMSAEVLKKELDGLLKGEKVVNVMEFAAKVRDLTNPLYNYDEIGRHDSQYKMEEVKELKLPWGDK